MSKQDRKAETHARMRDAASRGFRAQGYAGIGVDGIAKAAGVTSGAFYAHFGSKDGAFQEALDVGLDEVVDGVPRFQAEHGGEWVRAFADYYLGRDHRADLPCGCAMTTLSPEVARAGPDVQARYAAKMTKIAELMSQGLPGSSRAERVDRAWCLLATLIGGLTLARAVGPGRVSDQISAATKSAAMAVVEP